MVAAEMMCGDMFANFLTGTILPIVGISAMTATAIIAVSYVFGNAMSNPKLTLWSRTEAVQLVVSLASVAILIITTQTFCSIDMAEIGQIFAVTGASTAPAPIYNAALTYAQHTLQYTHNALQVVRYHLSSYMVLAYFNAFICAYGGESGHTGFGCWFGSDGNTQSPFGGYGAQTATMNIFFNSALMSHLSAMNSMFILLFVYKGFVFLFLPLGVFMRAMPYMRHFGSLLIAIATSFLIVYPFLLGVFYLMESVLLDAPAFAPTGITMTDYDESVFVSQEHWADSAGTSIAGEEAVKANYFGSGGSKEKMADAVAFAANAFLAGVFFPTAALLATIASIYYITRLLGEEVDLSRLTQMV